MIKGGVRASHAPNLNQFTSTLPTCWDWTAMQCISADRTAKLWSTIGRRGKKHAESWDFTAVGERAQMNGFIMESRYPWSLDYCSPVETSTGKNVFLSLPCTNCIFHCGNLWHQNGSLVNHLFIKLYGINCFYGLHGVFHITVVTKSLLTLYTWSLNLPLEWHS